MASSVTLASNTAEKQFVELVSKLQVLERDPDSNAANSNRITGSYNQDTGIFQGTFSIECDNTIDANGSPSFVAKEYLVDQPTT